MGCGCSEDGTVARHKRQYFRNMPAAGWCPYCRFPFERCTTQEEHYRELHRLFETPFPPPRLYKGQGIVITGEGKYWPGIVVSVQMLRKFNKTLPVQVWYQGPIGEQLNDDPYTYLIDSREFQGFHRATHASGFASKSYAILHSGFAQCMFLDADVYPVCDPAPLFQLPGFSYWSYAVGTNPELTQEFSVENWMPHPSGGTLVIDVLGLWQQLCITRWLDDHSDFWYQKVMHHDEGTWSLALSKLGGAHHLGRTNPTGIACTCEHDNQCWFVHRYASKLMIDYVPAYPGWPDPPAKIPPRGNFPYEQEVFQLFQALEPRYDQLRQQQREARRPENLRAARQQALRRQGR